MPSEPAGLQWDGQSRTSRCRARLRSAPAGEARANYTQGARVCARRVAGIARARADFFKERAAREAHARFLVSLTVWMRRVERGCAGPELAAARRAGFQSRRAPPRSCPKAATNRCRAASPVASWRSWWPLIPPMPDGEKHVSSPYSVVFDAWESPVIKTKIL